MQDADGSAIVNHRGMAATETSTRAHAVLDALYRTHVGDVYRYTYAVLGNHADAEDVTQTTFVNALRALERGEQPQSPSNWLLAIAHNVVRQRWRQAAARPSEVELVQDVPETTSDDEVELDGLVRALQRIPPVQREALVMRELEGRSYREIAELLGLTTSALETLLFRARRSLAEELESVVTCQSAELAISRQLDERLTRKERRRLAEHLSECADCSRLAEAQRRQRRAFKGLALLPLPVGLALFKDVPAAAAAALPTIGLGAAGAGGTTGVGAASTAAGAGATGVGAAGAGAASVGGAAVGGSLVGGAVAKAAAVIVAASVATGVGYEGVKVVRGAPEPSRPATTETQRIAPAVPATGAAGRADASGVKTKAARAVPSHGRKAAQDRSRGNDTVANGRRGGPNRSSTLDRTKPATKRSNDEGRAKDRTPKAPRKPGAGADRSKPKNGSAPPPPVAGAAAPPAESPTEQPSESPSDAATETPVDSSPATTEAPSAASPPSSPSSPDSAPGAPPASSEAGSTTSSGAKARGDNGNHNGWDNAGKAPAAGSEP